MKKATKHIFISFKSEEISYAKILHDTLENSGYSVWWQNSLMCAQEWHGEIDKAIKDAAAIIVIWSKKSIASPWVCHEASQAIAKEIYAPIRLEPIAIPSPFDRLQATDLINWDGSLNHPGYLNLEKRIAELLPKKVSVIYKTSKYLWVNKVTVFSILFALTSLFFLSQQANVLSRQSNILPALNDSLSEQLIRLKQLNELMNNLEKTTKTQLAAQDSLMNQIIQLKELISEIRAFTRKKISEQ